MRIEYGKDRIYLIPENVKDMEQLASTLPNASNVLCFYTYDAGIDGNEDALVITSRSIKK